MGVRDQRGLGKQIKRLAPERLFRLMTVVFNRLMRFVPFRIRYAVANRFCRNRAPYRFLQPDDTVVQVGSARDVLLAGRSRALHCARMVPEGRVVVIEADAANCAALQRVVDQHHIRNVSIVEIGAWDSPTTLAFLSSPNHPASNLLVDVKELSESLVKRRKYAKTLIQVDTIDNILQQLVTSPPALVSITTNGAELQILRGMEQTISRGCEFISLASTGEGFHEHMCDLGYEYTARDDRGYCFRKKKAALQRADAA